MVSVLPASALALTDLVPVGCLIAGSGKAGSIDECLHQAEFVSVFCPPVLAQPLKAGAKDETGKMRDSNPWQDQKAGVVGHQVQIPTAGGRVPTDELITRGGLPGRGTEQQAGNGAHLTVESDIFHMFADMPFASEIVVSLHQTMEQAIVWAATLHRHQLYGSDRAQIGFHRVAAVRHIENASSAITAMPGNRQRDKPLLLEFSQHAATGHILEQTRLRSPPPNDA